VTRQRCLVPAPVEVEQVNLAPVRQAQAKREPLAPALELVRARPAQAAARQKAARKWPALVAGQARRAARKPGP
jgi:hypothetical protein